MSSQPDQAPIQTPVQTPVQAPVQATGVAPVQATLPVLPAPAHLRLRSLDAFRGLVIVLMFLVNVAGNDPALPGWLAHRGWNQGRMGNGLADFVYPWFLFIVGVAIPFSMASGRGRDASVVSKLFSALRRGITIYLLGTLLWCATIGYASPEAIASGRPRAFIDWRVLLHWDILPMIGLAYFLGVCLHHLPRWAIIAFITLVLAGKYAILKLIPHPATGEIVWTQSASTQQWIRAELGWLGTLLTQGLPATAIVCMGDLAGRVLRTTSPGGRAFHAALRSSATPSAAESGPPHTTRADDRPDWQKLLVAGLTLSLASYAMHRALIPYSKDFMTSSFLLLMAGSAAAVLGLMYWLIDVRRKTSASFLRVFGVNALAIYVAAELSWKCILMQWHVVLPGGSLDPGGDSQPRSAAMIVALKAWLAAGVGDTLAACLRIAIYIACFWALAAWMDAKKLYIKV
ncbi:MAG: heparan-alpha-glucosaminide N-acetyltransferase domain-containing protein [Planctomycetota bacterium]|nr:heparan-alpha-glucosaminide N-acetyltransferase domain-containing protein [Planctomycetota bacterium]